MKKFFAAVITIAAIAVVGFSACYALGVFGAEHIKQEKGKDYGEGEFIYSGNLKDGLFDGQASLSFSTGDLFDGTFSDGRMNGMGLFRGREGWSFNGDFTDGEAAGGTFLLEDGTTESYKREPHADRYETSTWQYDGNFDVRGQDGIGTFTYADGSVYFGTFTRGMADGEGVYTDSAGNTVYEGGFSFGVFEGHGIYYSTEEGWSYSGEFKEGLFDGYGEITAGDEIIRGIWEKGRQTERYE
ncbi:hypothetical protein FACS189490_09650 [Clostridia bacterium]|nr:hypothetical protein FACS189490_09650 [Clostridia bacterium]